MAFNNINFEEPEIVYVLDGDEIYYIGSEPEQPIYVERISDHKLKLKLMRELKKGKVIRRMAYFKKVRLMNDVIVEIEFCPRSINTRINEHGMEDAFELLGY